MSFDPMAAAVDWLDAYRAGDIETILGMYAEDATLHCGCGGMKAIIGREGLHAYWMDRLWQFPASELDNLQPSDDGALISYVARNGIVSVVLTFDALGQIVTHSCGPSN
ncbi:nuclear transport factor 2 family protein [Bradyrhizobium sp. 197]|uniref:nuclear transport factor 2 family protein n=1 Tax=unclassified Bradyrhizobium TaxID=2631580 RepID=UPI001FFBB32A|nr:nuclear transport factor 2 family protein [Bradyrhizobium sp. 197]MCK1478489.1 nuclear transport factor 2 family protein [Bradyrhizobium sp. 197]